MKINEIKDILNDNPDEKFLNSLHNDPRKGVQTALKQYYKRVESLQKKKEAFIKRFKYEKSFWNNGIEYVAGIDEVGRGPLAGPVVACAVILPHDFNLIDVNDSKKLSEKKREELYNKILDQAVSVGIATGSCKLIDEVNIYEATRITMRNAVEKLSIKPEQLIIDAMDIDTTIPQLKLIKGDQKSISVSAASIIAKQYRDQLMKEYAEVYPGYEFEKNVGYGTKAHLKGLKELGVTPIHRLSFEPVKKNLK
ncbi:ribonuclease HII [Ligilactobacillus cholophilus]|uniref:ribonuclease HII n=1 Tax=Ligilactobacillus cholophilus TaxID=3050131 RepID=UPI0025AFB7C7|nr:ribonuclease HII [Ligilactobacillus cholophilus]